MLTLLPLLLPLRLRYTPSLFRFRVRLCALLCLFLSLLLCSCLLIISAHVQVSPQQPGNMATPTIDPTSECAAVVFGSVIVCLFCLFAFESRVRFCVRTFIMCVSLLRCR